MWLTNTTFVSVIMTFSVSPLSVLVFDAAKMEGGCLAQILAWKDDTLNTPNLPNDNFVSFET